MYNVLTFYLSTNRSGAKYLPIILTGDLNLEPHSGVYQFIMEGEFEYQGKGKNLEPTMFRSLSNSLIPPRLCVTDNCQHFNVLKQRLLGGEMDKVMVSFLIIKYVRGSVNKSVTHKGAYRTVRLRF